MSHRTFYNAALKPSHFLVSKTFLCLLEVVDTSSSISNVILLWPLTFVYCQGDERISLGQKPWQRNSLTSGSRKGKALRKTTSGQTIKTTSSGQTTKTNPSGHTEIAPSKDKSLNFKIESQGLVVKSVRPVFFSGIGQ